MGCSMMVFVNVTEDENGCDIIDQKDQEAFRIRIQAPENRVKLAERLRNKMEYDLMEDSKDILTTSKNIFLMSPRTATASF